MPGSSDKGFTTVNIESHGNPSLGTVNPLSLSSARSYSDPRGANDAPPPSRLKLASSKSVDPLSSKAAVDISNKNRSLTLDETARVRNNSTVRRTYEMRLRYVIFVATGDCSLALSHTFKL